MGVQRQAPRPASHGFITQRHVSRGRTRHVAALALGGGCPRVPFPAPRLGLGWRRPGGAEVVAGSPPCARGIYRRVDGEVAPGPFEPGPCKGDPGRPPGSALPQAPRIFQGEGRCLSRSRGSGALTGCWPRGAPLVPLLQRREHTGPVAEPRNVLGFYKQRHVGLDWGAPAPRPTGTARTPPKAPPPTDLSSHPRPGRLRASPDTAGLTLAPCVSPGKGAPLAGGHSRGRRRAGAPCRPPSLAGPRCSCQTTEVRDSTGLSREAG